MSKLTMLAAFGAGYVLGAKAGRDRYDEIVATAGKVRRDPRVQRATEQATETVKAQAPAVADKVKETADKVQGKGDEARASGDPSDPLATSPFNDQPPAGPPPVS